MMRCLPSSRRGRSLLAVALVASTIGLPAPQTNAQSCALSASPRFAGHTLPLDSDPVPQAMRFVSAFPALSFQALTGLHAPPDGSNRLFAVEQRGRILVFENRDDVASSTVFLDIQNRVLMSDQEQGLLGLAFDPDYVNNRRFYVNTTASSTCAAPGDAGCTQVIRFETNPANPNQAIAGSATVLLEFPQPYTNHNGGAIAFGPDGLLYVATGDGGSGGDPQGNAQNKASRLGKILRLDVRANAPSLVPATNPFVGVPNADPFVFHYGLRNPWRISFDRATGDLFIADVGQDIHEEVDRVPAGTPGGLDFGWNVCEAAHAYPSNGPCTRLQSTPPVIEYDHFDVNNGGSVIIGGYVYRGDAFPELQGAYLYADAASGNLWAWPGQAPANPWSPGNGGTKIGFAPTAISSFGEDQNGEIFAMTAFAGGIFRLARNGSQGAGAPFPTLLSATGLFSDVAALSAAPGLIEYDVTTPLWSDGATKRRWMALPGEGRVTFHSRDAWDFPVGTAFVKHFELAKPGGGTRRVETRVFLRQLERWIGLTYRWNTAQTDATLQTAGLTETIDLGGTSKTWHYPSMSECLGCHTAAAGRVLGPRTRNLEGPRSFAFGSQSQIDAWNCAGLFDFDLRTRSRYEFARALGDSTASRTRRARSYLATNCEICHQPGGPAPGGLDLRFTRAASQWNAINVAPTEGNLGFPSAKRILPGNRFQSILWIRQATTDPTFRMAKGTLAIDSPGVTLIGDFIQQDVANVDSDEDGIVDGVDVCPAVPDPLQQNADGDGLGDRCDPDAQPDLAVSAQIVPTGTVLPGQSLTITPTVQNLGAGAAASFPVTFYLSTNTALEPGLDVPIGHCWIEALAAGATTSCTTTTARIPPSFRSPTPGVAAYRFLACANRADVELEASSANDCAAASTPIAVPEPGCALLAVGLLALGGLARRRPHRAHAAPASPL